MNTRTRPDTYKSHFHLNTNTIIEYVERYGLGKNSWEMVEEIQKEHNCRCPKASLALAAILTGHIVIPHSNGKDFTFHKMT